MSSAIVAFLLALCKALPAVASVGQQFVEVYSTWKKGSNANLTNNRDNRDDAVVDCITSGMPKLCSTCPFAGNTTGQHPTTPATPGVSKGGNGST